MNNYVKLSPFQQNKPRIWGAISNTTFEISELRDQVRSELLLAYVSSQVSKANSQLDYVLTEWAAAGLPKPSFVRPKLAAIEPSLIVYRVGQLSADDLLAVDNCLRKAMNL